MLFPPKKNKRFPLHCSTRSIWVMLLNTVKTWVCKTEKWICKCCPYCQWITGFSYEIRHTFIVNRFKLSLSMWRSLSGLNISEYKYLPTCSFGTVFTNRWDLVVIGVWHVKVSPTYLWVILPSLYKNRIKTLANQTSFKKLETLTRGGHIAWAFNSTSKPTLVPKVKFPDIFP